MRARARCRADQLSASGLRVMTRSSAIPRTEGPKAPGRLQPGTSGTTGRPPTRPRGAKGSQNQPRPGDQVSEHPPRKPPRLPLPQFGPCDTAKTGFTAHILARKPHSRGPSPTAGPSRSASIGKIVALRIQEPVSQFHTVSPPAWRWHDGGPAEASGGDAPKIGSVERERRCGRNRPLHVGDMVLDPRAVLPHSAHTASFTPRDRSGRLWRRQRSPRAHLWEPVAFCSP